MKVSELEGAELVCQCDFRTKLIGDGCAVCNLKYASKYGESVDDTLPDSQVG